MLYTRISCIDMEGFLKPMVQELHRLNIFNDNNKMMIIIIPGNPCLQELQKIVLNGTAHLLLRLLSM